MLLSLRKKGLTSLFKEVRAFKVSQFFPIFWETDFYTPPVLGGAALLPFSAPAVYKIPVP